MMQPNRKEIKSRAREIIKGNIWNMWKPLIAIMLIAVLASTLISTFFYKEISCTVEYGDMIDMFGFDASIFEGLKCTEATAFGNLLNLLMTFAEAVLGVGVIFYILKLVRGEEFELKDINKLIKRQALHSYKISFYHPISNKYISLTCNVPDDMKNLM